MSDECTPHPHSMLSTRVLRTAAVILHTQCTHSVMLALTLLLTARSAFPYQHLQTTHETQARCMGTVRSPLGPSPHYFLPVRPLCAPHSCLAEFCLCSSCSVQCRFRPVCVCVCVGGGGGCTRLLSVHMYKYMCVRMCLQDTDPAVPILRFAPSPFAKHPVLPHA